MRYPLIFSLFLVFFGSSISLSAQEADSTKSNLQIQNPEGFDRLMENYQEELEQKDGIEGFRVQIYNGRKKACLAKRTEFISTYPDEGIEMKYEAPEYRVQVGNFRTRIEAEKFLKDIQEQFTGSFIVKTIIKLPKL